VTRKIELEAIGVVRSPVSAQTDEGWGQVESTIELLPQFAPGLSGLDQFSHALVLVFLHEAAFEPSRHIRRRPRGLSDMPLVGIFAQRAKDRPNPIGVTAVRVVSVDGPQLRVRGLDAIDGTPVIDIKPYFPEFDRVPEAEVPSWAAQLMTRYF